MQHLIGNYKYKNGFTAIEYGLIAFLFIVAAVSAIASGGEPWVSIWQGLSSDLTVVVLMLF